jgi:hypothetical protein
MTVRELIILEAQAIVLDFDARYIRALGEKLK